MKTFIVTYPTNHGFGLSVMLINNQDIEMAKIIAKENGACNGFDIKELDRVSKGIVFIEAS